MGLYATENLAEINLAMKTPTVQTIKRELEITFTTFVGNLGGILGLCLGFSLVSLVEVIYHCFCKQ